QAVDAPRLNHNWLPDEVKVERGRWPEEMLRALRMRGHPIKEVQFLGDAHSIGYDEGKNQYVGEADFRRYGSADAY
ncbi:MAG: gamma-glutamyltransferase, partial [Bacteroidetes bacterium]|nr:gamma-glutamyltransferase [Bacteroidota bacterium]